CCAINKIGAFCSASYNLIYAILEYTNVISVKRKAHISNKLKRALLNFEAIGRAIECSAADYGFVQSIGVLCNQPNCAIAPIAIDENQFGAHVASVANASANLAREKHVGEITGIESDPSGVVPIKFKSNTTGASCLQCHSRK